MAEKISVVVKPTAAGSGKAERFSVSVEAIATVQQLKEEIAKHCDVAAEAQRVIYKGQILKDAKQLDEYGIGNDHVVHMVKGRAPGAAPTTGNNSTTAAPHTTARPAAGAPAIPGMPANMQEMLRPDNPMMQAILSNPELVRTMMQANPATQRLVESNPELGHALNNPELLRESLRVMSNPNLLREHMRNTDVMMRNFESMPGGFDHLRRTFQDVDSALNDGSTRAPAATGGAARGGEGDTGDAGQALTALLSSMGAAQGAAATGAQHAGQQDALMSPGTQQGPGAGPNATPLPNPWAPDAAAAPPGGAAPAAAGANPFAALGASTPPVDHAMLEAMMSSPAGIEMMQSVVSNPELMRSLMALNPAMQRLMENDPMMQDALNNPERLRRLLTPEGIRSSMQMAQAVRNGQSIDAVAGAPPGAPDLSSLLGMLGQGMTAPAAPTPPANPEEAYASQLQQLQDMGFLNQEENVRALQAVNGNVHAAVERLLQFM